MNLHIERALCIFLFLMTALAVFIFAEPSILTSSFMVALFCSLNRYIKVSNKKLACFDKSDGVKE